MVTGCIVLYENSREVLIEAIQSFINCKGSDKLYLIDNSSTDNLKDIFVHKKIEYIFNFSNPGFGTAHNIGITKAIKAGSKYHFVINPDVYFKEDVVTPMIQYMMNDPAIGMMMPQILNDDGSIQNLPKLLPSPYSILMRKFKRPKTVYEKFIKDYELRSVDKNMIYNAPILSGCFTLLNLNAIKEIGVYDDRYFMYFEDWDLSRRMHQKYKTIYFPQVSIYHGYESGANKSRKLFEIFIKSALVYFNKWGWFFDTQRDIINKKALSQFK